MKIIRYCGFCLPLLATLLFPARRAEAQAPDPEKSTSVPQSSHPNEYRSIVYQSIAGNDEMLDVYQNPGLTQPTPVLIYFHGGAWARNARPAGPNGFRPYLAMGFSIVNVDYRLTGVATAPAAVKDARCALAWVGNNAHQYDFDVSRIVVWGTSSGGHLALMTGLPSSPADFDLPACRKQPKVAAVLDFYGISDVLELVAGPRKMNSADLWIGRAPDHLELAKRMSPLSYVRPGVAPVYILHGDTDPTVPYTQSERLHDALDAAGVVNKLHTVKGGIHGKFSEEEMNQVYREIREFLATVRVLPAH